MPVTYNVLRRIICCKQGKAGGSQILKVFKCQIEEFIFDLNVNRWPLEFIDEWCGMVTPVL